MRAARPALLPLLVVAAGALAWALRDRAAPEAWAGADPVVTDGGTAAHLRTVQLCLAAGQIPARDPFLDPPRGAPLPFPPLVDAALAGWARYALAERGGDPSLGGVDEAALERLVGRVGPWLGALTALGVFLAVHSILGERRGRSWWALGAAVLFAVFPPAVRAGAAGRVDVAAVHALLAAFTVATAAQLVRAKEPADVLQGGLTTGLLAGVAIACGPGALLYVPISWVAAVLVVVRTRRSGDPALAATARQAGLFLALASAILASLASGRLARDGPASAWLTGASELSFAAGVPFLLGSLLGVVRGTRRGWFARGSLVVGAVVGVAILPLAATHLTRALAPLRPGDLLGGPPGGAVDAELAGALRWMRRGTPSPGPWNASGSRADYAVLAPESMGHALAYHARRPPLLSGYGDRVGGAATRAAAALLTETDPAALALALRRRGVRYVVAGTAALAEIEDPLEGTVLWRLSTLVPDDAPEAQHFALVRAVGRRTREVGGETYTLPYFALYALREPPISQESGPVLRAR